MYKRNVEFDRLMIEMMLNKQEEKKQAEKREFKPHESIETTFKDGALEMIIPRAFLFYGKIGSGKSYAMKYLLQKAYSQGKFIMSNTVVFTDTKFAGQYEWIQGATIRRSYDPKVLKMTLHKISNMRENINERIEPVVIIFDDILSSINQNLSKHPELVGFITQLRHYNCTIFIATQAIRGAIIAPVVRNQISYAFMFGASGETQKLIYKSFASEYFQTEREFRDIFNQITGSEREDHTHTCMLIDLTKKTKNKAISSYRAGSVY